MNANRSQARTGPQAVSTAKPMPPDRRKPAPDRTVLLFFSPFFMPRAIQKVPDVPEAVHAVQWQPGRPLAGILVERPPRNGEPGLLPVPAHAVLTTRHGRFTVFAGDWVITAATGHLQVMSNQSFAQHYVALKGQQELFLPRQYPMDLVVRPEPS